MRTLLVPRGHKLRGSVEGLVRGIYARQYGAEIASFPPLLLAMIARDGLPVCAAGLRFANDGFFSECYLDEPVESVLAEATGIAADRDGIFEVSNLVTCAPALVPRFLTHIVSFGDRAGYDWAFFTATRHLRVLLVRFGLPMVEIGAADPGRVSQLHSWGSYYETDPRILAVRQKSLATFFMARSQVAMHA